MMDRYREGSESPHFDRHSRTVGMSIRVSLYRMTEGRALLPHANEPQGSLLETSGVPRAGLLVLRLIWQRVSSAVFLSFLLKAVSPAPPRSSPFSCNPPPALCTTLPATPSPTYSASSLRYARLKPKTRDSREFADSWRDSNLRRKATPLAPRHAESRQRNSPASASQRTASRAPSWPNSASRGRRRRAGENRFSKAPTLARNKSTSPTVTLHFFTHQPAKTNDYHSTNRPMRRQNNPRDLRHLKTEQRGLRGVRSRIPRRRGRVVE